MDRPGHVPFEIHCGEAGLVLSRAPRRIQHWPRSHGFTLAVSRTWRRTGRDVPQCHEAEADGVRLSSGRDTACLLSSGDSWPDGRDQDQGQLPSASSSSSSSSSSSRRAHHTRIGYVRAAHQPLLWCDRNFSHSNKSQHLT